MGQLVRNCPHCHTQSVSFTSFSEVKKPRTPNTIVTAFYCGNCYGGYISEIYTPSAATGHTAKGNIETTPGFKITKEYPLPQTIEAPDFLPENIKKFFLQAANSLKAGHLDASAMMSRKVLEVAVKTLEPTGNGSLYQRNERLYSSGKITEELKNWAHIIRDNGNEATNEEEPVLSIFSEEHLSFAEMFLMYTFTMPGMVASRRNIEEST
jgi:hypothetical protein